MLIQLLLRQSKRYDISLIISSPLIYSVTFSQSHHISRVGLYRTSASLKAHVTLNESSVMPESEGHMRIRQNC